MVSSCGNCSNDLWQPCVHFQYAARMPAEIYICIGDSWNISHLSSVSVKLKLTGIPIQLCFFFVDHCQQSSFLTMTIIHLVFNCHSQTDRLNITEQGKTFRKGKGKHSFFKLRNTFSFWASIRAAWTSNTSTNECTFSLKVPIFSTNVPHSFSSCSLRSNFTGSNARILWSLSK